MLALILSASLAAVGILSDEPVDAVTEKPAYPIEPHRAPPGYALIFSDEFNQGTQPDQTRWDYDIHRNAEGWYNKELQYYSADRPENARIENGNLIIEARKEPVDTARFPDSGGQAYTSARLYTKGKAAWTYGFFEVRAKLPCGRGTWPAIWLLPEDETAVWPAGGEIDIMEHVGYEPGVIHHSIHAKQFNFDRGTQRTASHELETACEQFHRYQLLWRPDGLMFAVDDQPTFLFRKKASGDDRWPFDKPMHLIVNIAVGGNWGGRKGLDDSAMPQRMELDYVRVYQHQGDPQ